MRAALRAFARSEQGANLVEYTLLVGVVALGALAALGDVVAAIISLFNPLIDGIGDILP
jgi:Flp pilus assembly pilin Flp